MPHMARPLRVQFPGAMYHVTSRMVGSWRQERNRLFADAADYQRFLARLAERVQQFQIRLYFYCLYCLKGSKSGQSTVCRTQAAHY